MVIEHVAKAYEATCLALRRCSRDNLNSDLRDALEESRENLRKALDELKSTQSDDRRFYDAILKYSLSKKAELGDNIADILRFLGKDR
jgi:predicted phage gp36 major capsid-like protein